ncbi:MAG TPA: zinc-ribbon domain containing protein [Acidobacteriaceae bacterium]|nr:zinc-ribbon domain containing protein [Acidobacteriaceae bacterium]
MTTDMLITCSDCGQEFTFTAGEQTFFAERGYSQPRRCKPCREQSNQGGQRSGGGAGFGGGGGGGRQAESTVVQCASCGQQTTVPFVPRGDRPVYCKACFRPKTGGGGGGGRGGSGGGRGGGGGGRGGSGGGRGRY